jgi:O-antigen/teichoic acid export membrane protein
LTVDRASRAAPTSGGDGEPEARQSNSVVHRSDSIGKNSALSLVAQLTTASLTAVLTLVLVRVLDPVGYGLFALALSMSTIALTAADLGISGSIHRFVAETRDRRTEVGPLFVDGLKLKLVVAGTICALLFAFAGSLAEAYGEPRLEWPLRGIAIATFGQSLTLMIGGIFIALGRVAVGLRLVAIESVIEVTASIALVLLVGGATSAAFGRAIGYIAGASIGLIITLRLLGHPALRPMRPPRRETVRRVASYASVLVVVDAAYVLTSAVNTLLLGSIAGAAANGIYSSVGRLTALIQYPGLSLSNGIAPQLARRPGRSPRVGALGAGLRALIGLQCLLLAPAVIWAEPITALLLGPGYERSADVLVALAPHLFFTGFAPLVSISVNYLGEARRRLPIAIITLGLSFGCALLLIPRYGVVGAAITSDIALGFYTLGHLWICRRLLALPMLPLAWALACGLTAAGGMAIVLTLVGTERELSLLQWVAGGVLGIAAYLGILVFTRELTPRELARLGSVVRAKLAPGRGAPSGPMTAAAAVVSAGDDATATVEPDVRIIREIGWRGTREGGVFELRRLDADDDAPSEATSDVLDWRWGIPPAPIPDARTTHGDLVELLLRNGWEPYGWGETWYATRLLPPRERMGSPV